MNKASIHMRIAYVILCQCIGLEMYFKLIVSLYLCEIIIQFFFASDSRTLTLPSWTWPEYSIQYREFFLMLSVFNLKTKCLPISIYESGGWSNFNNMIPLDQMFSQFWGAI